MYKFALLTDRPIFLRSCAKSAKLQSFPEASGRENAKTRSSANMTTGVGGPEWPARGIRKRQNQNTGVDIDIGIDVT